MGIRKWFFLAALLIVLANPMPGRQIANAQGPFTISGRVTEPPANGPVGISAVNLTLTLNGSTQIMTQTDGNGNFSFPNVPTGSNYEVVPSKPNYTFSPVTQGGDNLLANRSLFFTGQTSAANPIDQADFFVRQHYLDFFSRAPDSSGLAFWSDQITSCGTDTACIDLRRTNVSAAFFLSIEFQQTGYLVYRMYKAYPNLPGAPVPVRLNEFLPDTQQIGQGVIVGQQGWEQVLETNKNNFSAGFVSRQRFVDAYPTTLSPASFVEQYFTTAGVATSAAERQPFIAEFGGSTNTADVSARARALRGMAEHPALAQQEFNRAFVLMQYFGYLRRNPNDAPEPTLDFQGYNFWLNKLNQFNGNFINAEMVKAFITSGEYRQRFGP